MNCVKHSMFSMLVRAESSPASLPNASVLYGPMLNMPCKPNIPHMPNMPYISTLFPQYLIYSHGIILLVVFIFRVVWVSKLTTVHINHNLRNILDQDHLYTVKDLSLMGEIETMEFET